MKKLITTLGLIASANVFAYTANIDNQSNLDLVVKANGSTICTITAKTKSGCNNLDAYTTYAVNYKLNTTSEQGLFTLQKYSYQVLQSTPVTSNPALAHYVISYQANYAGGAYLGVLDNFINSQGGYNLSGMCGADSGGVSCRLSNGDNLQQLNITAQSDFVPAPAPTPTPAATKTTSGMYITEYGSWVSGTLYTPFWSNDVNAQVYPEVNDNGQTYVACYGIDDSIKNLSPSQVYQKQNWGPWIPFNNNQGQNVCDAPALKAKRVSGTAVKFW